MFKLSFKNFLRKIVPHPIPQLYPRPAFSYFSFFKSKTPKTETPATETPATDTLKNNISKGDTSKEENFKTETLKAENLKTETSKGDTSKAENLKTETSKVDPSKPDTSKPDTSKPDTSKPDTSNNKKPESQTSDSQKPNENPSSEPKPILSYREKLKLSTPRVSKCLEFGIYAWKLTFPQERYKDKFEEVKRKSREAKKQEEIILTEEELIKTQEGIPEWKRTALVMKESQQEKEGIRKQISSKFKNKFNETKFAKDIYKSDSFKEFETFKKEMHQFKEDFKDHVENSPNPVIQTSLGVYSKVSNESTVARAIREMRNIDPTFDLYELEDDAKGIFEAAYTTYLQGNMELLEKMCGEMALGYFKVLLRKMAAEKCEPKYKYLWQIDPAYFSTAMIPEKRLPVFLFTIKTQEIHCNISKIDKRIVDGDDERLMNVEYSFAITPHQNPDLENVGHAWELIEIQPRQVMKMLV